MHKLIRVVVSMRVFACICSFIVLALPERAVGDEVTPLFLGSYEVTLPEGVAFSAKQASAGDEVRRQLSFVDARGEEIYSATKAAVLRMTLLRGLFVETPDEVPSLFQRFTIVSEAGDMTALQMANARLESSFVRTGLEPFRIAIEPLQLVRLGETWWRYDAELALGVTVDVSVPSVEICRYFARESICIFRFLDSELDWQTTLSLPLDSAKMTDRGYEALSKLEHFRLPLKVLQSVARGENYRPCCRAPG